MYDSKYPETVEFHPRRSQVDGTRLIDNTPTPYGGRVPDLPECVVAGRAIAQTAALIRRAIEVDAESLRKHGEPVPEPSTCVDYVAAIAG